MNIDLDKKDYDKDYAMFKSSLLIIIIILTAGIILISTLGLYISSTISRTLKQEE